MTCIGPAAVDILPHWKIHLPEQMVADELALQESRTQKKGRCMPSLQIHIRMKGTVNKAFMELEHNRMHKLTIMVLIYGA